MNATSVIGFFEFAKSQVPDMKIEWREFTVKKNVVTVRGELSGTPQTPFAFFSGLTLATPKKSFKVMTIDTHYLKGHKVVRSYHLEDWFAARAQVSA